jgi:hypothetical protein
MIPMLRLRTIMPQPASPASAPIGDPIVCPRCGSHETRKVAALYADGAVHGGSLVHLVTGDRAVTDPGPTRDALLETLSPPAKRQFGPASMIAFTEAFAVCAGFALFWRNPWVAGTVVAAGVAIIVGSLIAAGPARRWNAREWPRLMHAWNQKMFCARCRVQFNPPGDAVASE